MVLICGWCQKEIDQRRQAFVQATRTLPSGQQVIVRYHARACYEAFTWFLTLHGGVGE